MRRRIRNLIEWFEARPGPIMITVLAFGVLLSIIGLVAGGIWVFD